MVVRRLRTDRTGSIYIEALISIAVLVIALVPILGAFAITPAAQRQAGRHTVAVNLARGRLEALHAITATEWKDLLDSSEVVTLDGQAYTIETAVESPREEGLRDVKVTVRWVEPRGSEVHVTLGTSVARRR